VPRREFNTPATAYIEAHIEQGPLLELQRKTIGVVTGIQGLRWFNVEVFGESAHAGTTPVSARKDALRARCASSARSKRSRWMLAMPCVLPLGACLSRRTRPIRLRAMFSFQSISGTRMRKP
jgi:hypothetical protein